MVGVRPSVRSIGLVTDGGIGSWRLREFNDLHVRYQLGPGRSLDVCYFTLNNNHLSTSQWD